MYGVRSHSAAVSLPELPIVTSVVCRESRHVLAGRKIKATRYAGHPSHDFPRRGSVCFVQCLLPFPLLYHRIVKAECCGKIAKQIRTANGYIAKLMSERAIVKPQLFG